MGNKTNKYGHENEVKHQYWIDKGLSEKLDKKIEEKNYKSRTEWYRDVIRRELD